MWNDHLMAQRELIRLAQEPFQTPKVLNMFVQNEHHTVSICTLCFWCNCLWLFSIRKLKSESRKITDSLFTLIIFPSIKKPWNLFKSLFSISFHSNKALRLFETGLIFAPEISWTRQNFFLLAIQIVRVFVSLQFPRHHCWTK